MFKRAVHKASIESENAQDSQQFRIQLFAFIFQQFAAYNDDAKADVPEMESTLSDDAFSQPALQAEKITQQFYQLPFAERAATALVIIEEFTVEDASKILGTDKSTVRSCLARARCKFNPDIFKDSRSNF